MKLHVKKFTPSSFLLRFLLLHLILVLLPVFVITQFFFGGYLKMLENEIITSNTRMLSQVNGIVDLKMREIEQTVVGFGLNNSLRPYEVTRNNYRAYKACEEMQKYLSTNGLLYQLAYYVRGAPLLYTGDGTYPAARFIPTYYQFDGLTQPAFMDLLENSAAPVFLPSQQVTVNNQAKQFITYFVPVPVDSNPFATAVFFIDVSRITEIVRDVFGSHSGNTVIFDAQGEVLMSLGAVDDATLSILSESALGDQPRSMIAIPDKGDCFLTTVRSNYKGWTYASYCPVDEAMGPAMQVRSQMGILLVAVFLLGLVVVWASIRTNYMPIQRMFKKVSARGAAGDGGENEILAIDRAIDALSIDNTHMRAYIEENREPVAQRLIRDLFRGDVPDMDTFREREQKSGLLLSDRQYVTLIFLIDCSEKTSHEYVRMILDTREQVRQAGVELYPLDVVGKNSLPVLLSMEDRAVLSDVVQAIYMSITRSGVSVTVGVSRAYGDPMEIALSYSQATSALAYRFIKGKNTILFYGDVSKVWSKTSVWYPKYEMEELVKNVSGGNLEGIKANVQSVIEHIKQEEMDIFAARCLCYDLINTVVKFVSELDIHIEDMSSRLSDIVSFSESETVDELGRNLDSFCIELSQYITSNKDPQTEQLLDYVRRHYTESDYSVRRMSDDLKMSYSYMSKYFHAKTGYTVLDYVTMLRLEKVKHMLVSTDDTIKEIILAAGYIDIPNFSRKFKQREGVTPGQYRDQYRTPKQA